MSPLEGDSFRITASEHGFGGKLAEEIVLGIMKTGLTVADENTAKLPLSARNAVELRGRRRESGAPDSHAVRAAKSLLIVMFSPRRVAQPSRAR
ncbi:MULTISPECIES: hypothetical protein [Achromobacter]|uniref:Uncharacterized protein n=1 Tax=Achromobacter marplatensis TaxID=470868 RepID=A0AA42WEZ2_9BURK|nr:MULTISPECIES: hypothetical protein [Achromobacter]MDH2052389.1 hypothetical protein [Achromobacter marplatensis]